MIYWLLNEGRQSDISWAKPFNWGPSKLKTRPFTWFIQSKQAAFSWFT